MADGLGWMAGVFAGIGRSFDAGPLVAAAEAEASRWSVAWIAAVLGLAVVSLRRRDLEPLA